MKRVLVTVLLAVALAIVIVLPGLGIQTDDSTGNSDEDTTITRYDADFRVADNGDLAVVETLTVDFPGVGKHGIFRFFDRRDPSDTHALRTPHDISVSMDGHPEPFALSHQSQGRYVVARIGDPDVTVGLAQHTYVIRYRIDGVLEPGHGDAQSQFYWNLIPGGWAQQIQDVHLVVHLPAVPTYAKCVVGAAVALCKPRGVHTETLTIDGRGIAPYTPLTLKAGLPIETPPAGQTLPWPARLEPILGDSLRGLVTVLVLAAAAGAVGLFLAGRTFERKPAFPLQYAPPPEVGPAEAAYVVTERVDQHAFVASMLWAAQQGAVELSRDGDSWTITDKAGADGWANAGPGHGGRGAAARGRGWQLPRVQGRGERADPAEADLGVPEGDARLGADQRLRLEDGSQRGRRAAGDRVRDHRRVRGAGDVVRDEHHRAGARRLRPGCLAPAGPDGRDPAHREGA